MPRHREVTTETTKTQPRPEEDPLGRVLKITCATFGTGCEEDLRQQRSLFRRGEATDLIPEHSSLQ